MYIIIYKDIYDKKIKQLIDVKARTNCCKNFTAIADQRK